MSKVCSLCGKKPVSGNNVSHSKRRTKRRFNPNLVSKKFGGIKVRICTSCLRTLKKPERVKQLVVSSSQSTEKKIEEKKEL
jgi:large subunit ribosomal protein L28